MSLQKFNDERLLFNTNFLSDASEAGMKGYRGELILVEGEKGDEKGHSKPPLEVMRGTVLLEQNAQLIFMVGALDQAESIKLLVEKYKSYFSAQMKVLLYVVNITDSMQVMVDGINFILIPLVQGVPWNEVIDELALEKSDFKGQSAADKIVTVYKEFQSYKPTFTAVTLDEALASTADIKREGWGAV